MVIANCFKTSPKFSMWQTVILEWPDGVTDDINRHVCTVTGILHHPQGQWTKPPEWAYQVEWLDRDRHCQEVVPQEDLQEVALPVEFYRGCKLCAIPICNKWQIWYQPLNDSRCNDLLLFSAKEFARPEEAIAHIKKWIDKLARSSLPRHIQSVLEGVGVPSWRADFLVKKYAGFEATEADRAQIPSVWREAALRSGEIFRGHCIVIHQKKGGWSWATGGADNQSWDESADTYPNRSKARLEARRAILRSGAVSAIHKVQ